MISCNTESYKFSITFYIFLYRQEFAELFINIVFFSSNNLLSLYEQEAMKTYFNLFLQFLVFLAKKQICAIIDYQAIKNHFSSLPNEFNYKCISSVIFHFCILAWARAIY